MKWMASEKKIYGIKSTNLLIMEFYSTVSVIFIKLK